jgi:alkylation response protein AidB-like acyl-CoA dehydrogenase/DNA-binding MarR family transcriptional regulator
MASVEPFFWWTEEQKAFANRVAQFVEDNVEEAEKYFWKQKFPHNIVKKVAKEGFFGPGVPKKYGGLELGATGSCIAAEQLGRLYAVGHVFTVSMLAGLEQILRFGTDEQMQEWLPSVADGSEWGAVCITEPFAGSDTANIMTTAVKDGDEWILNGKKRMITGAGVADRYFVYAKTSEDPDVFKQRGHISSFVVKKGMPGFTVEKINPLIGFDNVPNGYLDLDNVRVPDFNRVGEVGKGWAVMMAGLNFERLIGSAVMIGGAKDILKILFHYTQRRVQFGRPINRNTNIQFDIADVVRMYKVAKLFTYHTAKLLDDGQEPIVDASIAKMMNTEYMRDIALKSIQICGGDGLTKFLPLERVLRESKIGEIVAGTTEVQKLIIYRFCAMLPEWNVPLKLRWDDEVNAPLISNRDSKFKDMEINEENLLKVIAHDYKINPGSYMTMDDVRDDIGGSRVKIKQTVESLEQQGLIVTHRDRAGKIGLVKATYKGLAKAFPKEYYRWFPGWYEDSDKF